MAQPNGEPERRHPDTAEPADGEAVTERETPDDPQAPGLGVVGPDDDAEDVPEPNEPA